MTRGGFRPARAGAIAATVIALVAITLAGCAAAGETFTNPIKEVANDPYVIKDGSRYMLIESEQDGIWITTSADDDLTGVGAGARTEIWKAPPQGPNCTDIWAPELHHVSGKWYVYYAATTCDGDNANHRMFVLESESDDPLGPYVDKGRIADANDRWAIDGTRFEFGGRSYFVWSGWPGSTDVQQNLYIAEMSSPTTLEGAGVVISEPTLEFETKTKPINEGPQAIVTADHVFLVYSASASWTDDYCYGMLTTSGGDLLSASAWEKSPDAVFASTKDVFGPGHGSFTVSPDGKEEWMIYHSARYSGSGWDRVMNAQRYSFVDGIPQFGRPIGDAPQQIPSGQSPAPEN